MLKKNKFIFSIEKNSIQDGGDGVILFPKGLVITDDSQQWNGTRYDIKSMDISEFKGQLTANHSSQIEDMIGQVMGTKKIRNRVTVDGMRFAIEESAMAMFTYNMIKGGWITDVSIETVGPWPDEDGIYKDAKLIGLSVVVTGNNKSATINEHANQIAMNTIDQCRENGIDSSSIEGIFENALDKKKDVIYDEGMEFVTIVNTQKFAVTLKYKNAAGDEVEKTLNSLETIDVSKDQKDSVEALIKNAVAPKEEKKVEKNEIDIDAAIKQAVKPFEEKIESLEQKVFDNSAKEPEFIRADGNKSVNISKNVVGQLSAMSYQERTAAQINAAWDFLKASNSEAGNKLKTINEYHLSELKRENVVLNSVTLADFGNFVISPELLTEIQGYRSNFQPLLSKLNFKETLSLQMAWLDRNGDIDMQPVDMCDVDGGNLKPISEYTADIKTANLEELAAVTPVCNAATRFLAADLLGDVSAGYRNDYDRKKAQLFIARLQQAVDLNGNAITYTTDTDLHALQAFIDAWSSAAEGIDNGTFIFNTKTYGQLVRRLVGAGINGPLAGIFTTGDQPQILGRPFIVVPNELLPTLNTAETKTYVVNGVSVTINRAVFYVDLTNFTGRVSGGLSYDLSTEASYEVESVVKSAFQRNELVLRGSFFRGGAILDTDQVTALGSRGVS